MSLSQSRVQPRNNPQTTVSTNLWKHFDFVLLAATMMLVLIGILFIRSATLDAVDTDLIGRVQSQITYAVLGMGVIALLAALDYRLLGVMEPYIYVFMLVSLGLVA